MQQKTSAMSELIVDFPRRRRNSKMKRVQFSGITEITFFERLDETESSKIWYTPQDYRNMRSQNHEAVLHAHTSMRSFISKDEETQEIDGSIFTGIENLMTPALIRKSRQRRAQCISSVLEAQERQDIDEDHDSLGLACVSKEYSKSAVKRALRIGLLQRTL